MGEELMYLPEAALPVALTLLVCGGALGDQILRWPTLIAWRDCGGPMRVLAGRATTRLLGSALEPNPRRIDDPALLGLWGAAPLGSDALAWLEGVEQALLLSPDATLALGLSARGIRVHGVGEPPPGAHQACWTGRALGLPEDPAALPVPLLRPEPQALAQAHAWMHPAPEVLLLPGSGGLGKCWPRERFLGLGRALRAQGLRVAVVLGPDELERGWGPLGDLPTWMGPGLPELLGMMTQVRLVIGNDAGTSHLAAAAGARVLVLFGPTDPRRWRPIGPRVHVIPDALGWSVEQLLPLVGAQLSQ